MIILELPTDVAAAFGIRSQPGWQGAFTRQHAPGTWRPGTRIKKIRKEEGDVTPIGAFGTVLGSVRPVSSSIAGYFIEWDGKPRVATFMVEWKIDKQ